MTKIVSVSLSDETRDALEAEAKRQQRSRSWIVREAVAEYVAKRRDDAFDRARDRVLLDGLAMSPAERALAAEAIWDEFAPRHAPTRAFTVGFATFDAYEQWKRLGGGARA
jgi:predicted DNA-binding protein